MKTFITYKGSLITTAAEEAINGVLYRYYVETAGVSHKGCSYSTRARAIDAARKYVDRQETA